MFRIFFCILCICACCFADGSSDHVGNYPYDDDAFLQGYLQAYVDINYESSGVIVKVNHGDITLENLPSDEHLANNIVNLVHSIPINGEIKEVEKIYISDSVENRSKEEKREKINGIWLPGSLLFPVNIADSRQATLSGSIRFFNKEICKGKGLTVSMADTLPLFRWVDVWPFDGKLQLDVEAGVWALFDTGRGQKIADLINIDFRAAVPITYAFDGWAFRLRAYHTSSHLGDEYIIDEKICNDLSRRKNLSREAVDVFVSYQLSHEVRLYGGLGVFFHSDKDFTTKPFYIEYGAEAHITNWEWYYHQLNIAPFIAVHLRNWQDVKWKFSATCAFGVEWSRLNSLARKVRTYIELHNGYSLDGQFSKLRETYAAFKFTYGY